MEKKLQRLWKAFLARLSTGTHISFWHISKSRLAPNLNKFTRIYMQPWRNYDRLLKTTQEGKKSGKKFVEKVTQTTVSYFDDSASWPSSAVLPWLTVSQLTDPPLSGRDHFMITAICFENCPISLVPAIKMADDCFTCFHNLPNATLVSTSTLIALRELGWEKRTR